jgi:ribonuclease P protein component
VKPIKGNKKIEALFGSGKRCSSTFFHCIFELDDSKESGYVVSVPKKNFPRAVDRNKLKRLVREVIRKNLHLFGDDGFGMFMFVYSSNKVVSFIDIEKDFKTLIKKVY